MRHLIWDNDVNQLFDYIKDNPLEYFPELEEDDEIPTYETIMKTAHEDVWSHLCDEQTNLNQDLPGKIILVGTLERWDKKT